MKEHMPLEQKKKAVLNVDPAFKDTFQEEMEKSLEEQRQRFEEAKLAKQKSAQLKGKAAAGADEATQEQNLTQLRGKVKEKLPPDYNPAGLQGETQTRSASSEGVALPEEMKALLNEISGWQKVKAETSIPVKEAAKALKEAKNDTEAAEAMADLVVCCSNYMDLNASKMFKSSHRKKVVKDLLASIAGFIASADLVYYENFELAFAKTTSATAAEFEGQLASSVMAQENTESLEEGIEQKKRKLLIRAEYAEKEKNRLSGKTDLDPEEAAKLEFFTEEDRKKEFEEMKKRKPGLTEESYRIMEKGRNIERYLYCPQYNEIYENSKHIYKGGSKTFSREATALLKTVNFDKNWNPISKEDKERHEWNLRFLRAYDEDDFETREKMIEEDFPHTVDKLELPQFSKDELLKYRNEKNKNKKAELRKALKDKFEAWIEDFVRNGDLDSFLGVGKRLLSIDVLKLQHPGTTAYRKNNPAFENKMDLQAAIGNYMANYTAKNYYFEIGGTVAELEKPNFKNEKERKGYYKEMDGAMEEIFEEVLSSSLKLEEHKKLPEVPYEKTVISAGEQSKRIEARKLEKTKKERDRIRKEIEAEEQKKREEKEALRKAEKEKREQKKKEQEEKAEKESAEKTTAKKSSKTKKKAKMKALPNAAKKVRNESSKVLVQNEALLKEGATLFASRQTKLAKDIVKKNLQIRNDEKRTVRDRRRNAKNLTLAVNQVTDQKIRLRESVSLDIKKKMDHLTFTRLSDFAFMYGGQAELEKLAKAAGEAKERKKELGKYIAGGPELKKNDYAILDTMTAELLKMDLQAYDVSSDEAISRNAVLLEKMARGVESYQKLVQELGGSDYLEYLKEKQIDGLKGDLSQSVLMQLDRLSSIAKYYRLRKLAIEDEGYIEGKTKEDTFETDRLKKIETLSQEQSMLFTDVFRDRRKYNSVDLNTITMEEQEIHKLEEERFHVAPKWMYDAISMTKLKEKNDEPNPALGAVLGRPQDEMYSYHSIINKEENKEMKKVFYGVRDKMLRRVFDSSPVFKGGKDAYLEKISISDDWNRMIPQLINVLSYRRTPEEMREMMELLTIQQRPEWEEIKKDPEAVAYYESAFKEMAMREIASVYAAMKRVGNSMALKIMVMHPADLAMQMTAELKSQQMGAIVASNIDCGKESREYLKKIFEENNQDQRHLFDYEDFLDMEALTANTTFKMQNNGEVFKELIQGGESNYEDEFVTKMSFKQMEKMLFGMSGTLKAGEKEKEKYIKELEKRQATDPVAAEELKTAKKVSAEYFFLMKHPEVFNMKAFLARTPEGQYIFGNEFQTNGRTFLSKNNVEGLKNVLDKGKVKPLNEKELKAYEKSLKDRDMPKYVLEGDPYGIGLYRNHMDALVEKDKDGKEIYRNGMLKVKQINSMPDIDPVTGKLKEAE
ncbi:MAG: hypothetical protein K5697_10525 [Lachnospiraceae bacterium]|nr:hypothetical protein [Lachnospiraceae bacterium]